MRSHEPWKHVALAAVLASCSHGPAEPCPPHLAVPTTTGSPSSTLASAATAHPEHPECKDLVPGDTRRVRITTLFGVPGVFSAPPSFANALYAHDALAHYSYGIERTETFAPGEPFGAGESERCAGVACPAGGNIIVYTACRKGEIRDVFDPGSTSIKTPYAFRYNVGTVGIRVIAIALD